jgi:hypothetical protein
VGERREEGDLRWGTAAFAKAPTASSSTSTPTTPDAVSSTDDHDTGALGDDLVEPSSEERAEVWNVSV